MDTLVYVESPYQLENAISFLDECNKREGVKIVIRNNLNALQLNQFKKLVNTLPSIELIYLKLPAFGIFKFLYYPFVLFFLLLKSSTASTILIGDARSIVAFPLLKALKFSNKQVVLVDDGLYMLSYIKNIFDKPYTIYSSLPLEKIIEKNSKTLTFQYCQIDTVEALTDNSRSVYFIGMKITEICFISEELYFNYLKKIKLKFNEYTHYYFPHRGESINKLKVIEGLGFTIIKPEISIEDYFKKERTYGGVFITFFSTALYNLSQMIGNADFYYIKVDNKDFPELQTQSVLECYSLFCQAKLKELVF